MINNNYSLRVNEKFDHSINADSLVNLDILKLANGNLHFLHEGTSYMATITSVDLDQKTVILRIGPEKFTVKVADSFDKLVEKMGLDINVTHQINEIKAPMPGLVLSIEITEGQDVVKGDTLLVLEAMKMENVIKSPGEGKVKSIFVKKGKPVDKGEILLEFE